MWISTLSKDTVVRGIGPYAILGLCLIRAKSQKFGFYSRGLSLAIVFLGPLRFAILDRCSCSKSRDYVWDLLQHGWQGPRQSGGLQDAGRSQAEQGTTAFCTWQRWWGRRCQWAESQAPKDRSHSALTPITAAHTNLYVCLGVTHSCEHRWIEACTACRSFHVIEWRQTIVMFEISSSIRELTITEFLDWSCRDGVGLWV